MLLLIWNGIFSKEGSSMKTLLRGGYVVSGRGCRRADVLIDGE